MYDADCDIPHLAPKPDDAPIVAKKIATDLAGGCDEDLVDADRAVTQARRYADEIGSAEFFTRSAYDAAVERHATIESTSPQGREALRDAAASVERARIGCERSATELARARTRLAEAVSLCERLAASRAPRMTDPEAAYR